MKSGPIAWRCRLTRSTLPVASLTPTMFFSSNSRAIVSTDHVDHRARRDVVDDDRDADGVVDRLVVLVEAFLVRLVVVGRDDQHARRRRPSRRGGRGRSPRACCSSRRRRSPARGPSPTSMQISTTRLCSSWLSVGLSPVVPTGTRPCVPSAICHSTKARKASSSTAPSRNGVTSAVIDPLNMAVGLILAGIGDFATRRRP